MKTANVPAALGVAVDLRGAARRTSGVNLLARTVMVAATLEEVYVDGYASNVARGGRLWSDVRRKKRTE